MWPIKEEPTTQLTSIKPKAKVSALSPRQSSPSNSPTSPSGRCSKLLAKLSQVPNPIDLTCKSIDYTWDFAVSTTAKSINLGVIRPYRWTKGTVYNVSSNIANRVVPSRFLASKRQD